MTTRIGIGMDVHPLNKDKPLIVGGVVIPSPFGSQGHSDGDALIHAIVDALLGALGLGDIGSYFPSSDNKWKNVSSTLFLKDCVEKIINAGWEIKNIDTIVILQNPKISEFIPQIKVNLSQIIHITKNRISVKATTTDHLGFIGKEMGWATQAIALLKKSSTHI
ncbi:MAG TPA: 2-C-methyl-D-erythritol 2,4-cyclodiphosphate synthase [Candidatus Marinimicrobia bacterium]|jgi:2-C-methyl-D-erythritol 2,4-cyclodiphosphate synthase|nr:2-C-methyl-D-erythritol 2,4-cyclodiphosphate synthase [Candidatus Neomarinimicrobiota bacterium]|tara:strand:- start:464 stop:955 length:492 start_codon:yes stop_codon:yes gene_type:complete